MGNESKAKAFPAVCSADDAPVVREIMTFFYPERPPTIVTGPVASLTCKMFDELTECSKMIDYAPRPNRRKAWSVLPIFLGNQNRLEQDQGQSE